MVIDQQSLQYGTKKDFSKMSDLNQFMIDECPDGAVLLDIGANHGTYTIQMAKRASKVYAFEPSQPNLYILYETVKDLQNVTVVEYALSDSTGEAQLMLNANPGGHSIHIELANAGFGHTLEDTITVKTITLDDWAEQNSIEGIAGMKIDVEAHEGEVLKGAQKTLTRGNIGIALETHNCANLENVKNLLISCGYNVSEDLLADQQYYFKK